MDVLPHLLLVHVLIMCVSGLLSYLLWRVQRVEHMRRLARIWGCLIVTTGIQVVWRGNPIGIVLALACAYPSYFLMAELVAVLAHQRFRPKASHGTFAAALAGSLALWAAGLGFTWFALPVSLALGVPLVATAIPALRARRSGLSLRLLALINLLATAWGQSFPFLRLDEGFAPIGFTVGILFVFAFAVLAPLAIVEQQRDEFAAVASHELKAPLTPLQLAAGALAELAASDEVRGLPISSRLWRVAASANRQVEHLSRLANNLISISSFRAGVLRLQLEDEVDIVALVEEVAERLELQPDDLPASRRRIVVAAPSGTATPRPLGQWDRFKLDLVISNLLANALKYGEGKEVRAEIEQSEQCVKVVVRDQGIGIDEAGLRGLFAPYQRAANARGYSGMGIGLFVSQRIVQLHGGELSCESAPGRGSAFELILPRTAKTPRPSSSTAASPS